MQGVADSMDWERCGDRTNLKNAAGGFENATGRISKCKTNKPWAEIFV
jgi:hypothetical protein